MTANDNTRHGILPDSRSAGIQLAEGSLKAPHPALRIVVQCLAKEAARDWFKRHQSASNDT